MAASYTRRRLGGRHPSCGIGVTSRIAVISSPTAWSERMAASRPAPGPRTETSTCLSPSSIALRAATSAAVCAAKGVLLREPRKPALPALDQETTLPIRSVRVTIVLLKVAWMCAMPVRTSRRSRFLPPFLRGVGFCSSAIPYAPAFFGAGAPGAAGAAAAGFFFTITPRRGPFRVRAFVCVRWPRTRPARRGAIPPPPLSPLSLSVSPLFERQLRRRNPFRARALPAQPLLGGGPGRGATPPSGAYPCRALCRGFLQMMRVTPRRLMILQCSHRALIDGLTFIARRSSLAVLFESIRDPAAREVVRRQLDLHAVARQDPDEVHPHLAAHVREHPVAVVQLHSEHRVRQRLHHGPFDLDRVFFRHFRVNTSGSPSVTATVCSKWAARLPSFVTAVHPWSRILTSQLPIVTIGSIASTMPGRSCGPRPGSPKFGTWGSSWSARPIPCPTNARTTDRPCASTCDWTAWDTSESRRPGQHSLMASSRLSRVTSSSFWTFGGTTPTARVSAQSA